MKTYREYLDWFSSFDHDEKVMIENISQWYWARQGLEKDLTDEQEEKLMKYASDMYMGNDYCNLIRVMDTLVNKINDTEDTEKYINERMYADKEYHRVYEESFEY